MSWSPLEIKILLHYYARVDEYDGGENTVLVAEIRQKFFDLGLIDRVDYPHVTPCGDKLVKMWCETPVPVQVWLDPRTMDAAA